MKAQEFAGWTMFVFCWIGMETIAVRILTWLGVSNLTGDVLSPSWSWQSLVLDALTFFVSVFLILYVLEGVETDAKKDRA